LKGVPLRIAMGARDLENKTVEIARRDNLTKEVRSLENIEDYIEELLKPFKMTFTKKQKIQNRTYYKSRFLRRIQKSIRRKRRFHLCTLGRNCRRRRTN
jgi:prolyl-tRNA synthetase